MEALQVKSVSRFAAILIAVAVFTALVVANLSGSGQEGNATHSPANKVVASGEELTEIPSGEAVTIMSATLKTSNPTDLIMSVTLECSILTKLFTDKATTKGGFSESAVNAQIDVWIEENGKVVPISSVSSNPQRPGADLGTVVKDSVTFCQRDEGRRITDTEDEQDFTDKQQTYQETKTANAFNWVLLNAGSGIHKFEVKATLTETGASTCTKNLTTEQTCSDALIGNRTFVIEPTKLANDAVI